MAAQNYTHHAEPGHVHRWWLGKFRREMRCTECGVVETAALRSENVQLRQRVQALEAAMLAIYRLPPRVNGARYGGLGSAKEIASTQIALSQWHDNDEQTN